MAARFICRSERLLSKHGQLGYVTVNTVIEGATLRVGLEQTSFTIRSGQSPHPWPTKSANLQIVEFWASRAPLSRHAVYWLDGEDVPSIGKDLQLGGRRPQRLHENDEVAFQGSNILGLGFTLDKHQKDELIARNPRNAEVIQPYVIGKDLNQRPDCTGSRWVINFRGWPLARAEEYPECIDIVRRLVKPERDRNKRQQRRERWWIYAERAPELYEAINELDHVVSIARVSSSLAPVRVPTGAVYSEKCVIFTTDSFSLLALLNSNSHLTWTLRYTSTLRTDINYSPTDVVLTFPRPNSTPELETLGRQLDASRRELMLSRSWGLTSTYNRVHSPDVHEPAIQELRDIHVAIDEAVMRAYGWDDLDLKIGHHPTKIGIRWTVSKEARFELLDRLLEENHRRYKLEQGQ